MFDCIAIFVLADDQQGLAVIFGPFFWAAGAQQFMRLCFVHFALHPLSALLMVTRRKTESIRLEPAKLQRMPEEG
jgi:hypothetical protein